MARTTPTELRETVAHLQSMGYDVAIHWAYGRPRVTSLDGSRDISPRLSTGEMATWLNGFQMGASAAYKRNARTTYRITASGKHMSKPAVYCPTHDCYCAVGCEVSCTPMERNKLTTKEVRPELESWLNTASNAQRIAVDEFIGVLDRSGDSGSMHSTLEACINMAGIDYVRQCLDIIEWNGGHFTNSAEPEYRT